MLARRTLLVSALLVAQLVCLLVGVAWFARWLETRISTVVRQQVLDTARQVAGQFANTIQLMEIEGIPIPADDWDRLQQLVEETRLPNGAVLAVIDSDSGQLLAHPDLRTHPGTLELPLAEALLTRPVEKPDAWTQLPDGTYVLAATSLPGIGAQMLVLQPSEPLRDLIDSNVDQVRIIGAIIVVALLAFSGLLSYLIMQTYEDRVGIINARLEDLVERRSRALMRSREGAIFGLAKLAESRDGETGEHLDRISTYVELLARELSRHDPDLDDDWVHSLKVASSLHDIGKVGIPDAVLHKPGPLTEDERHVIQRHPTIGGETLSAISKRWGDDAFLQLASQICAGHHERWDGSGYPIGLAGVGIPLAARIVALADVYDALTSRRSYKDPMSHDVAKRMILAGSGTHFDPAVVDAFLQVEHRFREIADALPDRRNGTTRGGHA